MFRASPQIRDAPAVSPARKRRSPGSGVAPPCRDGRAYVDATMPATSRPVCTLGNAARRRCISAMNSSVCASARGASDRCASRIRNASVRVCGRVEALQANEGQRHQLQAVRQSPVVGLCRAPDFKRACVQGESVVELASGQSNQPEVVQRMRGLEVAPPERCLFDARRAPRSSTLAPSHPLPFLIRAVTRSPRGARAPLIRHLRERNTGRGRRRQALPPRGSSRRSSGR